MNVERDFPPLTRDNFETMFFEYISQLPQLIDGCLREANFKPDDVDYVVLTGGHSQWYFVEGIVNGSIEKFGRVSLPRIGGEKSRVIRLPWPQETVALGMVFQDITVAKRTRYCGGCGKQVKANSNFCPHCGFGKKSNGQPTQKNPQATTQITTQAAPAQPAGNLLKIVYASRFKGISTAQGKLLIYTDKVKFEPYKISAAMSLSFDLMDEQNMPMSGIARAERCTYMGMNMGIKLILKTGESFSYTLGARIAGVIGTDPQEIVNLINAQRK